MKLLAKLAAHPLPAWFLRKRFIRFGTVGASGVVVNLGVLYVSQGPREIGIIHEATLKGGALDPPESIFLPADLDGHGVCSQ